MATIEQIIGKVNPKLYASNGSELLKKYGSADKIPAEEVKPNAVKYSTKEGIVKIDSGGIEATHKIVYNSPAESLEPVYFWIVDFLETLGFSSEKLVDNFTSSPGSGHFGELGQRATVMQQQAIQMLGQVNTVLRSVLNIIYDLKEFRIRLQSYDNFKSNDKNKSSAALQSLKQVWLDKVDISKGNSSIKAMALGQAGFQTLLDAFLVVKNEKEAEKLDLNERVKRIVQSRIQEFNIWLKESEGELRKRYVMEKTYLGSQVNSLKLYSRWAKPYLKTAQQLEMKESLREPAMVKAFSTTLFELTLFGKSKVNTQDAAIAGSLPVDFKKIKPKRDYYGCVLVDLKFRGIPQRISQKGDYAFGGKAEVTFKAYALNEDEIKKLDNELGKADIGDVLKLIEGSTTESLSQLQDEINFFLEEKEKGEEKKKSSDESNPFLALLGAYDKNEKSEKPKKQDNYKPLRPDDWLEKTHIRTLAAADAVDKTFTIFDTYKKAHGMESYT